LGIHLIKSLADEIKYEFRDGKNVLILKKMMN
jgi:anti-sigma regulatory factor (Ser/Thr protein kinase)